MYQHLTDEQLVAEYADAKAYADEVTARLMGFKEELLRRFNETGQLNFENAPHAVTMRREAPSMAWMKRQFGITDNEVPSECMEEKISLVPDWAKVKGWIEGQNLDWRETYSPAIKPKPMKVK
jgi:hypothetical protein